MKAFLSRMWHEQEGVLSFEWTVLTSLLTIGVVSGIASVRDAAIDELGDLAQAMVSLDQSYQIEPPLAVSVHTPGAGFGWGVSGFYGTSTASGSAFADASRFEDCYRVRTKVHEFPRSSRPAVPESDAPPEAADPAL